MTLKTVVGVVFVAVFGYFVVASFGNQVAGYETFTQAEESGRRAHVVGMWMEQPPMQYDPERNTFSFAMTDEEGTVRQVVYANPKPANFEDAEKVVVDGQMVGDVFQAEHILVKCPSKYNEAREFEGGATPVETVSREMVGYGTTSR